MNCEICGKELRQVEEKRGLEGSIYKFIPLWTCVCGFAKDTEVMPSVIDNAIDIQRKLDNFEVFTPRENWLPPTNEIEKEIDWEGIIPPDSTFFIA